MSDTNSKPEAWRPSFSDLIAVASLIAAFVMWLKQPSWQWGLPITVLLIALTILTAVRHQSHPIRRALVAICVCGILIWAAWEPIKKSFFTDYPNISFQWPMTFDDDPGEDSGDTTHPLPPVDGPAPTPPLPPVIIGPAPLGQRPLISSLARYVFSCSMRKQTTADAAKRKDFLQKSLPQWGEQIGFDISMADVPGGFCVTVEAKTQEAKNRFLSLGVAPVVAVVLIDVQKFGPQYTIVARADLPKEYQNYSLITPNALAPPITEAQRELGFFLGGNDDSCRVI